MLDTNVNRPDFAWLNESSRIFLRRGYLLEGTEPEERVRYIADHAEKLLDYPGFADKFYHYMARGYYSLASPIWSNFGLDRGLPISCFGSWIGDSIYDIMSTTAEVGMMSKTGGGTSGYFGAIRPRGAPIKDNGHSDGSFNFAKLFDTVIDVISQGTCYEEGTEVLTDKGFKDFRDVKKGEDLLAHVDEYNNISYTDTYDLITEDHTGEMYHYYAEGKFDLSVTPNHRMVFGGYRYKGEGENIFPDWDEKTDIAQAKDLVLDDYTRLFYLDENTNVRWVVGSDVQVSKVDYQGKVYCATVPLGRLVVRRNNTVCVSGNSRKGQFAGYIDIEHPDIEEWLDIHKEGNPIQLMYYGVCIGDQWLKEMKEGDAEKRRIWAKVLQRKAESGIPYLFFKDNVNNQKPDVYKDKDMTIYASNLCAEIALPSSLEESFVCCLSSMNALYFDEWKDTDAVETMTYFLDAVMEEFIQKSKSIPMMEKAHRFATRHRAIGIGVLGWHSYLQHKHIAFESFQAMQLNNELFKFIRDKSQSASKEMAVRYGEPEVLKGYGRRNTTTMSVAPTKSSSFILGGVSPSVEPIRSNYYIKDLAKIKTTYRNPLLTKVLQEKGLDNEATWQSILVNDGSVQHLEGLSDEDKEVFKTWQEISQLTIIQQAAQRQKYIDQGQSINILVHPDTPTKDINQLYLTAHELGMKSIYYQFSMSAAQKFNRALLNTCTTCES
nr:MAG TPA: ribonucleotide-diphosphate reductase subunit alpha [Caudoviricetes sp.]